MLEHYSKFVNIKKITNHRKMRFREQTFARMKRKTPDLEIDDPIVDKAIEEGENKYEEMDYVLWLKEFDQFHDIPRHCKYKEKEYTAYLEGIISYLNGFLLRSQPLVGIEKLEAQFDKEFEEKWTEMSIPGWQEHTHKSKFFCLPTGKLFSSEAIMKSHMSGKLYKGKLAASQKMSLEEQKGLVEASQAEDKRIAKLKAAQASGTICSATLATRLFSTSRKSRVRLLRRWRWRMATATVMMAASKWMQMEEWTLARMRKAPWTKSGRSITH
jgi:hypothetical protein